MSASSPTPTPEKTASVAPILDADAPTTTLVEVDGFEVAYRRRGEGDVVLFLSGERFSGTWLPVHEVLASGHDVIAPDHPGTGASPDDDRIRSFDDLVLIYDSLLTELGIDRCHLVGHSFGAWLAANLAVYYPARFETVTLLAPSGLRLTDTDSIDVFRMTPEEEAHAQFNGREGSYEGYLVRDGFPEDFVRGYVEDNLRARLMWNPRYDLRLEHRLERVKGRTLVIVPQEDRIVPPQVGARFAELVDGARLETLDGGELAPSSHAMHIEHPDEMAALITRHMTGQTESEARNA